MAAFVRIGQDVYNASEIRRIFASTKDQGGKGVTLRMRDGLDNVLADVTIDQAWQSLLDSEVKTCYLTDDIPEKKYPGGGI